MTSDDHQIKRKQGEESRIRSEPILELDSSLSPSKSLESNVYFQNFVRSTTTEEKAKKQKLLNSTSSKSNKNKCSQPKN